MVAADCSHCKSIWYQLCQYCHEYAKSNQGDCKINLICASYEPQLKRRTPAKVLFTFGAQTHFIATAILVLSV